MTKQAAPSHYSASIVAARAMRVSAPPQRTDGDINEGAALDPAEGDCGAKIEFTLGSAAAAAEAAITCANAPLKD